MSALPAAPPLIAHETDTDEPRRWSIVTAISVAVIAIMVFVAIFAPWIAPQSPNEVHLLNVVSGPSSSHWLGADSSGRDILSRLIYGARLSLLGPLFVILIATVFGVPMGLLAGYKGGVIDGVLSRAGDVVFAFPPLLLAIVIVATFGTGFRTAVIAVSVTYVPLMARVVRSATLTEREKPYIDACRVQGFGVIRTCARHIAPSLARLINSQLAVYFAYSLLDLAALSFLGLGTQPPTSDWGGMLSDAQQGIFQSWTGVIPPAVAIVLLVVSFSLFADRMADRSERR